jgi:hypothetical protein
MTRLPARCASSRRAFPAGWASTSVARRCNPPGAEALRQAAQADARVRFDVADDIGQVCRDPQHRTRRAPLPRCLMTGSHEDGGGKQPEGDGVGQPREDGGLEPEVVSVSARDGEQVREAAPDAEGCEREGEARSTSGPDADAQDVGGHLAGDDRLLAPVGGGIAFSIDQVVRPPDRELPGEHRQHRAGQVGSRAGGERPGQPGDRQRRTEMTGAEEGDCEHAPILS